jgi:phenylacetic acid degradation protein paaN
MNDLYDKHRDTLEQALDTIDRRAYWSPHPEHPKAYGEDAPADGEAAFQARLGKPFPIDQPHEGYLSVEETSPYGIDLSIEYPSSSIDDLVQAATAAMTDWGRASPETRAGVLLEALDRLAAASFEMGNAVMATTGQSFIMAFQAGGPHALDRALEAIAYTYAEQHRLPGPLIWEKPQGKRDPLVIHKQWVIRPLGVAVALGVSTFPTWNGYPGIFASLAAGNPVIVKPHPATILPFAIMVETVRGVLAEAGFDPNLVTLLTDTPDAPMAKDLVMHPEVAIVDYTGGPAFGNWLEENVHHALVYTEKAGVNSVILDSAEDLEPVFRNLSVSMSMYSGQMCTTPQNLYIPRDGVRVGDEVVSFDDAAAGFAAAVGGLLEDDSKAVGLLGAIKSDDIAARVEEAASSGEVLLDSRDIDHPGFPGATVRSPVVVGVDAADRDAYMREMFGPVIYVIATDSTDEALSLAAESAREKGAITWLVYTTDDGVKESAIDAAVDGGVSIAFNLTGGLYVNQSAAFSDFHVTGHNPAGNASLTDPAFVTGRFKVIGVRDGS